MPIENPNQRSSAVHIDLPWRGIYPYPDTQIGKPDRLHAATLYAMDLARAVTSTNVLQNPVNCVLAGQQTSFKTGRAAGRALKHAFGE